MPLSSAPDAEALFRAHYDEVYRYLVRLCGDADQAADLAQEALLRLVKRPPPHQAHRPWLFRVAANLLHDQERTRSRRRRLLEQHAGRAPHGDGPPDPAAVLESREAHRRVRAALDALPARDRAILLLRGEGFSHAEIAAAVETTTGSVGTLAARALRRLSAAVPQALAS